MGDLAKACEHLRKNGFTVKIFERKSDVVDALREKLLGVTTVGIGGSITIRELGIVDILRSSGVEVLDHWREGLSEEEVLRIRKRHLGCEAFLSSVNAVTEDGKLVSIDGIGNRVAAMIFGPSRVFVVAGKNKVVKDVHEGVWRAKNIAAPRNAARFGYDFLPCVSAGRCVDCDHPKRICRAVVILERRPFLTEFYVYLVNEELGF